MDDVITPVFWWWVLEECSTGTLSIMGQYDSEEYEKVNPHEEPGIWNNAARLQRACYVAEYCVLVLRDLDGEPTGWMQIILDEGWPSVSNCSVNLENLVHEAMSVSNSVNTGAISFASLGADTEFIRSILENNND